MSWSRKYQNNETLWSKKEIYVTEILDWMERTRSLQREGKELKSQVPKNDEIGVEGNSDPEAKI